MTAADEDLISRLRRHAAAEANELEDDLYEAIRRLTAMGEERDRLREALEKIEKAPAWGAPDFWQVTPSEVRQLARAALNPQEPTHAD